MTLYSYLPYLLSPLQYSSNRLRIVFRSLPLLLPAVEDGIFNDSWRIRQSSVELLGDLLFKVISFQPLSVSHSCDRL